MTTAGPDLGVVRRDARSLRTAESLDPLLDRAEDAHCVLLGAAGPGTTEFHHWRAELTRRLIEERGFTLLAVEDDWPVCTPLRHCVTQPAAGTVEDTVRAVRRALSGHRRWPTWPWANTEVLDLAAWLGRRNADRPEDDRIGVFGLDLFGLRGALPLVTAHVREHAPDHLADTLAAFAALDCAPGPWSADPRAALAPAAARDALVSALVARFRAQADAVSADELGGFTASQHARGLREAEHHYRALLDGVPEAWNARERHLADMLDRLLQLHGGRRHARAVVWAHNVHVADARGTGLADAGLLSLGRLVRERYGPHRTVLTGFAAYRGTVTAADRWEGRAHVMEVPPARAGSLEDRLHHTLPVDAALFLVPDEPYRPGWMRQPADHRSIGVVYRPEWGDGEGYAPTVLGQSYDAFLYVDHTSALTPLHAEEQPYHAPPPEAL